MNPAMDQIMFEESALLQLSKGSFEETMTAVDQAVAADKSRFGENAILFATYPGRVIVVKEDGDVCSVKYKVSPEGTVRFYQTESVDVPLYDADKAASKAIDNFFEGGSMAAGLVDLVKVRLPKRSSLDEVKPVLSRILSGGNVWKDFLENNKQKMAEFAFDPEFGSPKIETKVQFTELYDGDIDESILEDNRERVVSALAQLEKRLSGLKAKVAKAYENYIAKTGNRSQDDDAVLSQFESLADDYLNHLDEVNGFIAESMNRIDKGCVSCLAFVHDGIAEQISNLELGGRLIRRVSTEFES